MVVMKVGASEWDGQEGGWRALVPRYVRGLDRYRQCYIAYTTCEGTSC